MFDFYYKAEQTKKPLDTESFIVAIYYKSMNISEGKDLFFKTIFFLLFLLIFFSVVIHDFADRRLRISLNLKKRNRKFRHKTAGTLQHWKNANKMQKNIIITIRTWSYCMYHQMIVNVKAVCNNSKYPIPHHTSCILHGNHSWDTKTNYVMADLSQKEDVIL